jgi:hypothetical protein
MTDFLRVGSPRLDPLMDTSETAASRWIRERAHTLMDAGVGIPSAFQQARADYAKLAMRGGTGAINKTAKTDQK